MPWYVQIFVAIQWLEIELQQDANWFGITNETSLVKWIRDHKMCWDFRVDSCRLGLIAVVTQTHPWCKYDRMFKNYLTLSGINYLTADAQAPDKASAATILITQDRWIRIF